MMWRFGCNNWRGMDERAMRGASESPSAWWLESAVNCYLLFICNARVFFFFSFFLISQKTGTTSPLHWPRTPFLFFSRVHRRLYIIVSLFRVCSSFYSLPQQLPPPPPPPGHAISSLPALFIYLSRFYYIKATRQFIRPGPASHDGMPQRNIREKQNKDVYK